jgi:hypothetical protein
MHLVLIASPKEGLLKKLGAVFVCAAFCVGMQAQQAPVPLNSLVNFAVLGGTTVTNTGFTVVNGELGLSTGSAVTGFPPGVVTVLPIHIDDNPANTAQADLTTAYNNAAAPGRAGSAPITQVGDLGGLVLAPGLYVAPSTTMMVGIGETLTLNGTANSVWVFQVGSSLTVLGSVVLTGGAQASNVFWAVNQSATLGSGSVMQGTIMAGASISLGAGGTLTGRALAKAAVTMITNTFVQPGPPVTGGVPPALTVFCPASTAGVGTLYASAVVATGGTTPYTLYSITPGVLPAGLALNSSTGAVTGTPSGVGSNNFTANVTDSAAGSASSSCNITTTNQPPTVPAPSSLSLVLIGLACAAVYRSRERIVRLARRG